MYLRIMDYEHSVCVSINSYLVGGVIVVVESKIFLKISGEASPY